MGIGLVIGYNWVFDRYMIDISKIIITQEILALLIFHPHWDILPFPRYFASLVISIIDRALTRSELVICEMLLYLLSNTNTLVCTTSVSCV